MQAPPSYKEPDFETPALQRTKVKNTWDDDEPDRKILTQKFKADPVSSPQVPGRVEDSGRDFQVACLVSCSSSR